MDHSHSSNSRCTECGHVADAMGTHHSICKVVIAKHRAGVAAIFRAANSAGLRPLTEICATLSPLDQAGPADILLPSFSRGQVLIIDFTVATALSNVEKAATGPNFRHGGGDRLQKNQVRGADST